MTIDVDVLVRQLGAAKTDALRELKMKRAQAADESSIAFDAGVYEGIRKALDVLSSLVAQNLGTAEYVPIVPVAVVELIQSACRRAQRMHETSGKQPYDAGRFEGLKEALCIVESHASIAEDLREAGRSP